MRNPRKTKNAEAEPQPSLEEPSFIHRAAQILALERYQPLIAQGELPLVTRIVAEVIMYLQVAGMRRLTKDWVADFLLNFKEGADLAERLRNSLPEGPYAWYGGFLKGALDPYALTFVTPMPIPTALMAGAVREQMTDIPFFGSSESVTPVIVTGSSLAASKETPLPSGVICVMARTGVGKTSLFEGVRSRPAAPDGMAPTQRQQDEWARRQILNWSYGEWDVVGSYTVSLKYASLFALFNPQRGGVFDSSSLLLRLLPGGGSMKEGLSPANEAFFGAAHDAAALAARRLNMVFHVYILINPGMITDVALYSISTAILGRVSGVALLERLENEKATIVKLTTSERKSESLMLTDGTTDNAGVPRKNEVRAPVFVPHTIRWI